MDMHRRAIARLLPAGLGALLSAGRARAGGSSETSTGSHPRRDIRSQPIRRLVVMGESNAYGMSAGDARNEWVQSLAGLIRRFQDEPVRVFNNAM